MILGCVSVDLRSSAEYLRNAYARWAMQGRANVASVLADLAAGVLIYVDAITVTLGSVIAGHSAVSLSTTTFRAHVHSAFTMTGLDGEFDSDDDASDLLGVMGTNAAPRDPQSGELSSLLPGQEYFAETKSIRLSFAHASSSDASPLDVTLSVDASPGCGGIVWPAGQVLISRCIAIIATLTDRSHQNFPDPLKLSRPQRQRLHTR